MILKIWFLAYFMLRTFLKRQLIRYITVLILYICTCDILTL